MRIQLSEYRELLSKYLRPQWRKVLVLTVLLLTSIGLQVANPQVIRYFIDTALAGGAMNGLIYAALIFLGAALAYQALTVAATYVGEDVGWSATNALREDLARHALRLDMAFHNEHTPGQMIERIDGDVADLAIFFATLVIRIFGSLLLLLGVLIALTFVDWRISLALTVYAVAALTALFRFREYATPFWQATREVSANLFGFLEEHLAGTEDIRSSGAVLYVLRELYRFGRQRLAVERKAGDMSTLMIMLWTGFYMVGQVLAFSLGYGLFRSGLLTIGTVYLIVFYTDAIFRPLREITNEI